ncbi:hypothetical protein BC936DRAFT_145184 [Jimgerdemannia flammicorona]|uniref:MACPF domain-containing protein n=1 Tax=Jimgerdemannia flammicorona TaxID=994334 RepID=A0A433DAQ1_9FUNG|nr:hypothetical protein BC936DRAFT_145184 [Jimgerdemannia flammicorona]
MLKKKDYTRKQKKSTDRLSDKDNSPSSASPAHHEDSPKQKQNRVEKVDIQSQEFTKNIPDLCRGRITVSEIITEHRGDREKEIKALAEAKASVNGTITGFGKAGFGAGFTIQSNRGATNAADFSNQQSRLQIIGGRPTSDTLDDRTIWQRSLQQEPSTWEVILREELIPIYELLDNDMSTKVKEVMEASLNEERIASQMKLNLRSVETKYSFTLECIRVRRNSNEPNPFSILPHMLKDKRGLGYFASKLNEVMMLDTNQIEKEGGSPDFIPSVEESPNQNV